MSLQRFSFCGEHTHTLTVVAVSLHEHVQDRIPSSIEQRRPTTADQAALTVSVSIAPERKTRWILEQPPPPERRLNLKTLQTSSSPFNRLFLWFSCFSPRRQKLPKLLLQNTLKYTLKCAYSGLLYFLLRRSSGLTHSASRRTIFLNGLGRLIDVFCTV